MPISMGAPCRHGEGSGTSSHMRYGWGSSSTLTFEGPWSSYSPSITSTWQKDHVVHVPCKSSQLSKRTTLIWALGLVRLSEEVGCIEVHDQSSLRPLVMSISQTTLGLEGSEGGALSDTQPPLPCVHPDPSPHWMKSCPIQTKMMGCLSDPHREKARTPRTNHPQNSWQCPFSSWHWGSKGVKGVASSSPPTSISKPMWNWELSNSDENEHSSSPCCPCKGKMKRQRTGRLFQSWSLQVCLSMEGVWQKRKRLGCVVHGVERGGREGWG